MTSENLGNVVLGKALEQMKKFNAKRKFRLALWLHGWRKSYKELERVKCQAAPRHSLYGSVYFTQIHKLLLISCWIPYYY